MNVGKRQKMKEKKLNVKRLVLKDQRNVKWFEKVL